MKTVFLMGDSIRMGYDRYVRDALADEAAVYYPSENCRFAQYTLRNAHDWIEKECQPECVDVVHWNAGLWDVARLFGDEPPACWSASFCASARYARTPRRSLR